jgi:DNA-binding transcriptional MerR regulator
MDKFDRFLKKDAASLLEVRPSLVQYYTDQGIVVPEEPAYGKGTRRIYSRRNLLHILITKRLVENGVALGEAREILEGFENQSKHFQDTAAQMEGLENFPRSEKARWKEKARLARMLWEISSWDGSYNLFLCIHKIEKQPLRVLMLPVSKDKDSMEVDEKIGPRTGSLIVLNITDLVKKVSEL